jgi:hypothetical protein
MTIFITHANCYASFNGSYVPEPRTGEVWLIEGEGAHPRMRLCEVCPLPPSPQLRNPSDQ